MVYTFVLGYMGIILETLFEFNKAGIALVMSVALWVIYGSAATAAGVPVSQVLSSLSEHMGEVSEVVYFLMGAMTIVEIVDAHQGFKVTTE